MKSIEVESVLDDKINIYGELSGCQVTLVDEDNKTVVINIPDICWRDSFDEIKPIGLNLVFGEGEHYC